MTSNVNALVKSLVFLGKSGFVVGSLLGGITAPNYMCNTNQLHQVISRTITYGTLGFMIGITFPVSMPCINLYTLIHTHNHHP